MAHTFNNLQDYNTSLSNYSPGDDYHERLLVENRLREQLPDFELDASDAEHPRHLPDDPHNIRSHNSTAYQYHDDDDEGYSLSTAAHHTSALTFTAGLEMAGNYPSSHTGYDQDRPLTDFNFKQARKDMSVFSHTTKPSLSATIQEQRQFSPRRAKKPRSPREKENQHPQKQSANIRPSPLQTRDINTPRRHIRLPDITGI